MATLTVQEIGRAGITPSYGAAAGGGDQFINDGNCFVHIKNGGGSAITVTFTAQGKIEGETITSRAVSVTNAQERMIGPFPTGIFNDTSGYVQVTYSAVTSVTLGIFRLPHL